MGTHPFSQGRYRNGAWNSSMCWMLVSPGELLQHLLNRSYSWMAFECVLQEPAQHLLCLQCEWCQPTKHGMVRLVPTNSLQPWEWVVLW
jgi:hypothetical protein